jgi:hypothetical protein
MRQACERQLRHFGNIIVSEMATPAEREHRGNAFQKHG